MNLDLCSLILMQKFQKFHKQLMEDGVRRMALNTPIQGSAADILKKAMIEIDREMTRLNLQSKMLVQVHDELVFEVKEEEIDILKDLVIKIMTSTYKLDVPLEVDYEIGDNWYDAK